LGLVPSAYIVQELLKGKAAGIVKEVAVLTLHWQVNIQ
jgi:hypothetical protein